MELPNRETGCAALYEKFLCKYTAILDNVEGNPYKPVWRAAFDVLKIWRLGRVLRAMLEFLRIPNTLRQELVGCDALMAELSHCSDREIALLSVMNDINCERFRRRHIGKFFVPAALFIFTSFWKFLPLLPSRAAATAATVVLIWSIVWLACLCLPNSWLFFRLSRFVQAFGDVLRIENTRRQKDPSSG